MNSDHLASAEHATPPHEQPNRPALAPELKAAWVKALRSGEYRQGRGSMFWDGQFCCLGVLRNIINPEAKYEEGVDNETSFLPERYAGGLDDDTMILLARMNDGECGKEKHSFEQIAAYIEKSL